MALAASVAPGCVARDGTNLKPPSDDPVNFPDAEIMVVTRNDLGQIITPDGEVVLPPDGGVLDATDGGSTAAEAGPDDDGGTPRIPTYWEDVYPIVFSRCAYCHANDENDRLAGIPPIVTFAHTQAASPIFNGQSIATRMAARVLNQAGTEGDMPQRGSPFATAMTLEERRTIVRWAQGGAPEGPRPAEPISYPDAGAPGDASPLPWANGPVTSDAGAPGVRYIDVFANQGGDHTQPHFVQGRRTNYHCFVFTVPPNPVGALEEFATEMLPILDQRRHIHHIELYLQDPANPRDPVGGTTPADWHLNTWWDCQGRAPQEQLIANWVPGQPSPIVLPPNTGYRIRAGDRLMLEIHYDSVPAPAGVTDMTGLRITTTTQTGLANVGEFWVGPNWTYNIAPVDNPVNRRLVIEGECRITAPVTVFWAKAHMHERGRRQVFWIRRGGGPTRHVFADVNPFDPGNQPMYEIPAEEQLFNVGDVVGTSCEYETMGRNLIWGYSGEDEMCFFNMNHYPNTFPQNGCFVNCNPAQNNCPVTILP